MDVKDVLRPDNQNYDIQTREGISQNTFITYITTTAHFKGSGVENHFYKDYENNMAPWLYSYPQNCVGPILTIKVSYLLLIQPISRIIYGKAVP